VTEKNPKSRKAKDIDVDRVAEIERLATLDPINYETARTKAAVRLKVRASVLDREVTKKRRKLGLDTDKDDGQGRAVKITDPLPWHEPVSGDRLAATLAATVKHYLVLSDAAADVIALWVIHTWIVNAFTMSPRLAITSPTKGCGKTTVLRLLAHVVRRAKRAGSISPPALFRAIEQFHPTILLDETEKFVESGGDLHALLNEGHCKGGTVLRVLGEKLELREFSVFGAMAFARNGRLPDDLEQRSIVIEMQRRRADENLSELRDDRSESLQQVAKMCARWADDYAGIVADTDPDMQMINRNRDNWRPLFAIANVIGEEWPERVREAAAKLAPREADSHGTTLLADIRSIFDARTGEWADRIFSETLASELADIEGGRWAEFGKARKAITKNQLANLLKGFKVTPESVWIGSKSLKGYQRHQFEDAWTRYLDPLGVFETSERQEPTGAGTSTPFQNVRTESVLTFQKSEKPLGDNGSDALTFEKGGQGLDGDIEDQSCRQCDGTFDGTEQQFLIDENRVWLHPECHRFFVTDKQADDDLEIPAFLRRSST
jgi:hypothetical protein